MYIFLRLLKRAIHWENIQRAYDTVQESIKINGEKNGWSISNPLTIVSTYDMGIGVGVRGICKHPWRVLKFVHLEKNI